MAKYKVSGTGFNERQVGIRRWCKPGMMVNLFRELTNAHDENAISVSIWATKLFGLISYKYQIGYIDGEAAIKMAARLDAGEIYMAVVDSVYVPKSRDFPKVILDITFVK